MSQSQRDLFNATCLSILNYLETFEDCKQIEFKETVRVQPREIDAWERKNLPYKLPDTR